MVDSHLRRKAVKVLPEREPLVTIGMPIYNGAIYLPAALASVVSGSYPHWELLIVDDGSTDGSRRILDQLANPRIRVITNEYNQGLVAARNRILDEARGSFIAWLDQDDLSYPIRLASQVSYLRAHPSVSICGSWSHLLHEEPDGRSRTYREKLPTAHDDIRAQMLFSNPMKCNTVMMRRRSLTEHGLRFRPEFGNALDYDLWARSSELTNIHNLPQVLGAYRIHAHQTSRGDALSRINQNALEVQRQLFDRSLGITMSAGQSAVHARLTLNPETINSVSLLEEAADWLHTIRAANCLTSRFQVAALDRTLARQWITALLGATRAGLGPSTTLVIAPKGAHSVGLPAATVVQQLAIGLGRLIERKTRSLR
jgi:hypothetical protein